MTSTLQIENGRAVPLADIPVLPYEAFAETLDRLLAAPTHHCVAYYAVPFGQRLHVLCAVALDETHRVALFSHELFPARQPALRSLTASHPALHAFEREMHEQFGIAFEGHPWLKPVRYPHDRARPGETMAEYPFYTIDGDELHEVGVGPIHAGIIEPGHFRFLCHGETVLHLEIQLGYQHRGVERLMVEHDGWTARTVLAESIAGDAAVGHATTFALTVEALAGLVPDEATARARTLALELERLAVHTGDLSAMCTDVAYQLGAAVLGTLRTPLINFTQRWCGNRLGRGLIRPGRQPYPLTPALAADLRRVLDDFAPRFREMADVMFGLRSVSQRFEKTGIVTPDQALRIGAVGMAARMAGLTRDVRTTHPVLHYRAAPYRPVVEESGDVLARALLRRHEIEASLAYIRRLLADDAPVEPAPVEPAPVEPAPLLPAPAHFALALIESWRGMICHAAVTDAAGALYHYKVVDPSFHNWLALALAVRNNEISDFPICNKSFNLSYCGHDL